jgi:site-specific recombinase XerD
MAIDAKCSFLNQMEKRLSSEVTADAMSRVLSIISDVMAGFDFREYAPTDTQPDDLLECYIDAMRVQGRSEKTIERYRYIIGRLNKYVKVPARMVTVHHLRAYLAAEKARGVADSTLEGLRQVFSSYFGWLFRETLIDKSPVVNLGSIKIPKKQKDVLSDMDIEKLKAGSHSIRDKAIIMFLAATGCRISEVTGLDREHIDFNTLRCRVHGKGDKERTAYFDSATGFVLQTYLNSRKDEDPALFLGRFGERLNPDGVRAMLKKLAAEVGVDHVHPHKFRRTRATELARHGMPIQEICKILGHEKIDTTLGYLVLDEETTNHSYRKYA